MLTEVTRCGKSNTAASKPETLISQLLDNIETKFPRLDPRFRKAAFQYSPTKPEVGNSSISGLEAVILDFPFPVRLYSIGNYSNKMLDLENVGVAVGI